MDMVILAAYITEFRKPLDNPEPMERLEVVPKHKLSLDILKHFLQK